MQHTTGQHTTGQYRDTTGQHHHTKGRLRHPIAWAGVLLASCFWLFDAVVDALVFDGASITDRLVPATAEDLWMRLVSVSLVIAFGFYVQRLMDQQKQAGQQIEALTRQKELILGLAGEGIYAADVLGRITLVNPAAARMLGYEPAELTGRRQHDLFHHTRSDGRPVGPEDCPMCATLMDGAVHHVTDGAFRRKDGSPFPVDYISTPIREHGELNGAVVCFRDITESRRHEEHIKRLNRLLSLWSTVNQTIVRIHHREDLFREVCRVATEIGGFIMAWIGLTEADGEGVTVAAYSGIGPADTDQLDIAVRLVQEPGGPLDSVIRDGMQATCNDIERAPEMAHWQEAARRNGFRACALFPLHTGKRVEGVLAVYAREADCFDEDELGLLNEVAEDISFALVASDREERRWHAEEALERLSHRHELILRSAGEGIFGLDMEGRTTFVNPAAAHMLGYEMQELVGRHQHELIHHTRPDGSPYPAHECPIYLAFSDGAVHHVAGDVFWRKDGTSFPVEYISTPAAEDGKLVGAVVTFKDIAKQQRAQEAVKESEAKYRSLVEQIPAITYMARLGAMGEADYVSPQITKLLGYTQQEWMSDRDLWRKQLHADDRERVMAEVLRSRSGIARFCAEYRLCAKDGRWLWLRDEATVVRDANGIPLFFQGVMFDITARVRAEEQIIYDAFHDALTGLPNRALFMDRLGRAAEHAKRRSDARFAVLFLDIDSFKVVNDSLGHLAGDELLTGTARRLEQCLRTGDTVARLGGDEFAVLLEDVDDVSDATRVSERIQAELARPFNLCGQEVFVSASIGIAMSISSGLAPERLVRDADTAMYRAKALGKARYEVFDEDMHERAVERLQLETDLRRAVERCEFVLHYQPIISLANGRITALEALIRWRHPQRGLVPPDEFIPVAEETGLIVPIGAWVLKEACRQMQAWQVQFNRELPIVVSVNLSGKQFLRQDLIEQVNRVLAETGLDPSHLGLEITESVVMENAESTTVMLAQIRALNIHLSIDDFGTGYSSLSYLHRFPVNTMKIDRSFVSRIGGVGEGPEIVRSILALAHNLGLEVVAEGVETEQQLERLRSLGCDYAQGFLFAKPLDGQTAGEWVGTHPEIRLPEGPADSPSDGSPLLLAPAG